MKAKMILTALLRPPFFLQQDAEALPAEPRPMPLLLPRPLPRRLRPPALP